MKGRKEAAVQILEKIEINTESRLIQKARGGNLRSFSALVEVHQEKMIHAAFSFLGNMEDAKDAAQEAFIKAHKHLSSFNEKSRFSTWLYRILINHCKDFMRKKKSRQTEALDPQEDIQAAGPNALGKLMGQEIETEIHRALENLPFQQRSVFALRYLEGLKLDEIAESLNLSTGAVKAHLWQAGQKMRQTLAHHFPGREGMV